MSEAPLNPVDVVFLGPSLPREEARAILPDAIFLSPASMGDVLAASTRYRPRSISIIDGTFLSNMSVYHKEILFVLDHGTWVLGASSMGALRAAECDDYGMIGVGQIYEALASGELEDDDEVALTHADEAAGFRPLSDAMVSIRATLAAAREAGVISAPEADQLIAVQKKRYFPDRRLAAVAADAAALGIGAERCGVIKAWIRENAVDPKREDAIALLHRVKELPDHPVPVEDRPVLVMTGAFSGSLSRDTFVDPERTPELTHDRIRRYASLHRDDYPQYVRAARMKFIIAQLSVLLGGNPTKEEYENARQRIADRVGVPVDQLNDFFVANDVNSYGVMGIIADEAAISRMEKSWLIRSRMGALTQGVIAEMVLSGAYQEVKEQAALQYQAAATVTFDPPPSAHTILETFCSLTGFDPGMSWDDFVDDDDHSQLLELIYLMEVSVKAHHALFGTGLVQSDGQQQLILDTGPMQTRGR